MKVKKNVTEKVIRANRTNGRRTPGPSDTSRTRFNATKYGLFSSELRFADDAEARDFQNWKRALERESRPDGLTERAMTDEVAVSGWRMRRAYRAEQRAVLDQQRASRALVQAVSLNSKNDLLPLLVRDDGSPSEAQLGWECEELTVQTGTSESERQRTDGGNDAKAQGERVQLEARLTTSRQSTLRALAAAKRDWYCAIRNLRAIQSGDEKP